VRVNDQKGSVSHLPVLPYVSPVTAEQIIGLVLVGIIMLCGLAGTVLPVLPGTPLMLIAAIAHRLYFGSTGAGNWVLAILTLLTVVSVGLDYLASTCGARKLGATWRGMLGAILGAVVGLFFGIIGIFIGPFIGAMLLELAGGYPFKKALRAGVGAFIGLIAGALGKFAIGVVMLTLFVATVVYRSMA
jgi:uncharacterized protein